MAERLADASRAHFHRAAVVVEFDHVATAAAGRPGRTGSGPGRDRRRCQKQLAAAGTANSDPAAVPQPEHDERRTGRASRRLVALWIPIDERLAIGVRRILNGPQFQCAADIDQLQHRGYAAADRLLASRAIDRTQRGRVRVARFNRDDSRLDTSSRFDVALTQSRDLLLEIAYAGEQLVDRALHGRAHITIPKLRRTFSGSCAPPNVSND